MFDPSWSSIASCYPSLPRSLSANYLLELVHHGLNPPLVFFECLGKQQKNIGHLRELDSLFGTVVSDERMSPSKSLTFVPRSSMC